MVATRAVLVFSLLGAVLLSGCGGSPAATVSDTTTPYIPAEEGHTDDTGAIVGRVVDEEHLPLKGALVGFIEPYIADVTDETGYFEIGQLTPGKWALYVIHLGHKADGLYVNVQPGQETKVTFVLPILPVEEPWQEVRHAAGSFTRSIVTEPYGTSWTEGNQTADHETNDHTIAVTGVVVALDWENSQAVAQTGLRIRTYLPGGGGGSTLLEMAGRNAPIVAALPAERIQQINTANSNTCGGEQPCLLRTTVTVDPSLLGTPVDVGVAFEQRFDAYVAFFYRMPVPADFSPIPTI